jgi:cbb3-type cytochrome oxidase subunit 3
MELILMLILFLAAWFWLDSMGKRERAILLGSELAARYNLQLLDESVACTKLRHVQFLRRYAFDVSARGVDRLHCELILLGDHLQTWHIPPYQQ